MLQQDKAYSFEVNINDYSIFAGNAGGGGLKETTLSHYHESITLSAIAIVNRFCSGLMYNVQRVIAHPPPDGLISPGHETAPPTVRQSATSLRLERGRLGKTVH